MNYNKLIRRAVSRKWHTDEQKQWWWTKFSAVRRQKMLRLYDRQKGICCYCGQLTAKQLGDHGLTKRKLATLEHIKTQSEGGTDHFLNLIMSCYSCNLARMTMDHKKFLKIRSDPILWIAHMRKRSTLFHELTRQRAALRDPKRKARLHKVALKLGVLFIVSPGWAEAFERLRVAIITDHKTRLFEQANNSDLDLIDLVNLHYTD